MQNPVGGGVKRNLAENRNRYNNRFVGFTLSEVLIALVIIGVVAAITMPVLYANYQEQALKTALKKNYSALKQALDRYQADNGERLLASDCSNLKSYIKPYLNVMYDCGEIRLNSLCVPMDGANSNNEGNSDNYKTYNGKTMDYNLFDDGQYVLSDGALLLFEGNSDTTWRVVSVDVNGYSKKPNRLGKDLFMFQLMETGELLPMGANGTTLTPVSTYCSNTSSNPRNGGACTYVTLKK